jgi:isocitrate/isopropylmalate dehydrogenase
MFDIKQTREYHKKMMERIAERKKELAEKRKAKVNLAKKEAPVVEKKKRGRKKKEETTPEIITLDELNK